MSSARRRIGIIGFGSLGRHLFEQVEKSSDMEVDFVWNRTPSKLQSLRKEIVLSDLKDVSDRNVDLIVEVADPSITVQYASLFLKKANYLIGSPTCLCNEKIFGMVQAEALANRRSIYIPSGAFWGAEDVKKMADNNALTALSVTMRKHPSAFRLQPPLAEINDSFDGDEKELYSGPVKDLCPLAPNNVNTMAVACLAGHTLGFGKVMGRLVADKTLADWHVVEAEIRGQNGFVVNLTRKNPAPKGAVSGLATYNSFWSALKNAKDKPPGIQMC